MAASLVPAFAFQLAAMGGRNCGVDRETDEDRHQHNAADEHVEEDGEGAGFYPSEEAGAGAEIELPDAGPECRHGSDGGHEADGAPRDPGRQ